MYRWVPLLDWVQEGYSPLRSLCPGAESWWTSSKQVTATSSGNTQQPFQNSKLCSFTPHFQFGKNSFGLKYFQPTGLHRLVFLMTLLGLKLSKLPLSSPQCSLNQTFHRWSLIECSSFSGWLSGVLVIWFAEVLKFTAATKISCALSIWRAVWFCL